MLIQISFIQISGKFCLYAIILNKFVYQISCLSIIKWHQIQPASKSNRFCYITLSGCNDILIHRINLYHFSQPMLKCCHVRRIYFVQSIQKNLTFTCSQNLVCRFIIERRIKHANRFNNAAKQITSGKSKIPQFHQYWHNTCLRILLHRFYKQVSKHHRFTHTAIGNKSYHIGLLSYFIKSSILYHCTSGWHTSSRIRTINSTQCVTDKHILHFAEFIRKISLYL